ncbi:MAG: hypothetical protein RLZZ507_3594 [Cyanobacteriota bacterium]|jgi:hypothetical protein
MSTNAEYEAKISQYGWDDLIKLWTAIELGNTKTLGWDAGKALEYLVLRAFQLDGADVTWPYSVRIDGEEIEQIDGVVYVASLACLIECKDMDKPAKIEPIAKLRNQLLRRPVTTIGSVFSRKGFTEAAETLAGFVAPQTILLWVGSEIKYSLENKCISKALLKKYWFCIEQGLPNYNITMEAIE